MSGFRRSSSIMRLDGPYYECYEDVAEFVQPVCKKNVGPTTFEEAIQNTGFGKFNVVLVALTVSGIFSPLFETTTMSYIFAPAQCDLQLTLEDKGYLNSACYAGMISSAFVWGFLLDILGRRKLMIFGYFLDATFVFMSGFSQSFAMLLISKFFGGLIISGPFAAMPAYLSEFHSTSYRSRIQVANGTIISIAQLFLPLLAWGIMPLPIQWTLFDGLIQIHSWNLFLLITGLCPLLAGTIFIFLPESPKFLMSSGENENALKILQTAYSCNTGNPPEKYPVTKLLDETQEKFKMATPLDDTYLRSFKSGLASLLPLFRTPLLSTFVLVTILTTFFMSSLNMFRLWLPQLFQALEDYKVYNNGSTTYLCTMLEVLTPKDPEKTCSTNISEPGVYINSIIVAACGIAVYILTGFVIHILGKKTILVIVSAIGSISIISLYFAHGTVLTTLLASTFIATANVSNYVCLGVTVDLFPTSLRAFTVSLVVAFGRIGVLIGNIIFPKLLEMGCGPPFFVIGCVMAVGGMLCFLLPNTDNKALQ